MVSVTEKKVSHRRAVAQATVRVGAAAFQLIRDNQLKKGGLESVVQIAGIQAAKQTAFLIPLCHPLQLTDIQLTVQLDDPVVRIECAVECVGNTGVEMEAMTGAAVAALTVYDMCKGVDKGIVVESVRLVHKSGGKSDYNR